MFPSLAIVFPSIDPVAFTAGPFTIHWYALSYVAGILLGWIYIHFLNRIQPSVMGDKALDDIILWAVIGIILGGRIGYILFYNAPFYLSNPQEILKVWHGGMSFHGGLIGVILSIIIFCRKYKIAFWPVIDVMACATPIGLCLGRFANFINAELYGRVTDVAWGVIFPGNEFARHPSQIYEAILEGLVLFIIMWFLVYFTRAKEKPGMLSGFFLIFYGLFRATAELFREPDLQIGFLPFGLTMGQVLCVPMIVFGVYLVVRRKRLR